MPMAAAVLADSTKLLRIVVPKPWKWEGRRQRDREHAGSASSGFSSYRYGMRISPEPSSSPLLTCSGIISCLSIFTLHSLSQRLNLHLVVVAEEKLITNNGHHCLEGVNAGMVTKDENRLTRCALILTLIELILMSRESDMTGGQQEDSSGTLDMSMVSSYDPNPQSRSKGYGNISNRSA
jgi:hypothetical protein